MTYLYSFLFVGLICMFSQIVLDRTKFTPGHVTTFLVVLGCFLEIFHIYDKVIDIVGGGAAVPIISFGHSLTHGALEGAKEFGLLGLSYGMFTLTSSGIVFTIAISFVMAIFFKPKD